MLSAAESVKSVTVITGGCPVFRNARAGGAGNTQSGSHCVGSGAGGGDSAKPMAERALRPGSPVGSPHVDMGRGVSGRGREV